MIHKNSLNTALNGNTPWLKFLQFLKKVMIFKQFVGRRAWRGFNLAVYMGVFLFLSETLAAISIPLFLVNLNLLTNHDIPLFLQKFPQSLFMSLLFVFFCVLFRSVALAACQYTAGYVRYSFLTHQRKKLIYIGISQRSIVSSHTILYFMNDIVLPMSSSLQSLVMALSFTVSVIILIVLGSVNAPWESSISITLLSLSIISLKFWNKKISRQGQQAGIHSKKLIQSLTEGFKNFFLFKIYGQLTNITNKIEKNLLEYDRTHKIYTLINVTKANISLIIGSLILCSTILFSHHYLGTSGAKLLIFFYLFVRMIQYCAAITFDSSDFIFHIPKIKELYKWTEQQYNIIRQTKECSPLLKKEKQNFLDILSDKGIIIEAQSASFAYPGSKLLFQNINFGISTGEPLIIKGKSGSGKSTLLMLLLGHLEPIEGRIIINGINAAKVKELLYRHVGYVGAESYIIQGSVRSNLLCGHQGNVTFSDDDIWHILREVQLDQDIRRLKNGLDHDLLELTQLSTGQKQRLAIARALLRQPKLLLLDEATANLDQVTEKNFINVLSPKLNDITSVIISHKPSFDNISNNSILLEMGGDNIGSDLN